MDKSSGELFEIGPQYSKDNLFTARMRFHQSWYRARVLKVPFGVGPHSGNSARYGNMLLPEDGKRGLNFLTPHIFEVSKRRLAHNKGMVEPYRLLNNMLSSQPMCFNLFGLLVDDIELAKQLLHLLLPDEIHESSSVSLEYAPEPAKDYLNDRTAFDAFAAYINPAGKPGFLGIETKLTESFSAKSFNSPFYNRWTDHPNAPWLAGVHTQLQSTQVNQLWRDHLLAVAIKFLPGSHYKSGQFMVIYHPMDVECTAAIEVYKSLLKPDDVSFIGLPLDKLVKLWMGGVTKPVQRQWLSDFSLRYLELEASESEFLAQKPDRSAWPINRT